MNDIVRRQLLARAGLVGAAAFVPQALCPPTASAAAAAPSTTSSAAGVNVKDYGALGNGVADDSAAVKAAIDAAGGDLVFFPAGTYLLNKVSVTSRTDILLGVGAVLRHKGGSGDDYMFGFSSTFLRIRGGTLDGNKAGQTGRTVLIGGGVESGKEMVLEGVHVQNSVKAVVYAYTFGGTIDVTGCSFVGQAEHDGVAGHLTTIVSVVTGQAQARGHLRFNGNTARGTGTAALPGAYPGGVFFAPTLTSTSGSLATFEAIGNAFYGYGQNCAGNTIAPLHTYPSVSGARFIGNYFEKSGTAAISAKSVVDFVCTDNVVVDGLVHAASSPAEGAITYAPSYHAGSTPYPRAIISSNVISNPGGTVDRTGNGICVFGSTTSLAQRVLVTDNIIEGCGTAITAISATDLTIRGNVITGLRTGPVATSGAIRVDSSTGKISICANHVTNYLNTAVVLTTGMQSARVRVHGNQLEQNAAGGYAMVIGAMESISITGNDFSGVSYGYTVRGTGTLHVKRFHTDASNTFVPGKSYIVLWADVDAAFGDLAYVNTPVGVIAPGEIGTRYTRRNGTRGNILWIATGTTRTSWAAIA